MNVGDVRTAIAAALEGLSINSYDYVPDSPVAPAAYIYPDPFPVPASFDGDDDGVEVQADFVVRFLVQSNAMQTGQQQLDAFISTEGSDSAVLAIQADSTLGGAVQSVQVTDVRNYGVVTLPDSRRYLSAELVVNVFV